MVDVVRDGVKDVLVRPTNASNHMEFWAYASFLVECIGLWTMHRTQRTIFTWTPERMLAVALLALQTFSFLLVGAVSYSIDADWSPTKRSYWTVLAVAMLSLACLSLWHGEQQRLCQEEDRRLERVHLELSDALNIDPVRFARIAKARGGRVPIELIKSRHRQLYTQEKRSDEERASIFAAFLDQLADASATYRYTPTSNAV